LLLGATLHFRKEAKNFLAECRSILNSKFTIGIAQNTMRWGLLKVILKNQAVSTDLDLVVGIGRAHILDTELKLDRHRATIRKLYNIVGLPY
jgi:CRISPR/Cas system CMR subunit Cmr6 (Cas7 group RAMP superfamily)